MKLWGLTIAVMLLALGLGFAHPVSADEVVACLSYQGRAMINGMLVSETFPGPPEYESIDRGDTPEIFMLVKLAQPLCVDADPNDDSGLNPAVPQVDEVQLALTAEEYNQYHPLIGKSVRVSGKLLGRLSEADHTPVVLHDVTFGE